MSPSGGILSEMDYFWDSSDDDNDLEVVRDDGPEDSVVMELVRD